MRALPKELEGRYMPKLNRWVFGAWHMGQLVGYMVLGAVLTMVAVALVFIHSPTANAINNWVIKVGDNLYAKALKDAVRLSRPKN